MASRKKNRNRVMTVGRETKVRQAEELRALFNATETTKVVAVTTEATETVTATVLTDVQTTQSSQQRVPTAGPKPAGPPQRTRPAVQPLYAEKSGPAAWWLGPVLLLATLLLFGLGWFHVQRARHLGGSSTAATTSREGEGWYRANKDRIEFYKRQMGQRLNRDRISTEIDNQISAPALSDAESVASKSKDSRPMMFGVPLMPEGYQLKSDRDRTEPVPIDHPDARIQYSLQEEQHHADFRKKADQAYLSEFMENARKEGFEIKVDSNLNVISVEPYYGSRKPSPNPGPPATSH